MAAKVKQGVYRFFSRKEIDDEVDRYKDEVKQSGSDIASSSVADESFSYGPRRDMNLAQWSDELQNAGPGNQSFVVSVAVADMR